jgi:dihydroxy-acid dehydratase
VKLDLAKVVKEGCKEEGLVGLIFNTIGVRYVRTYTAHRYQWMLMHNSQSDAITMGTDGRRSPLYAYFQD